MGEHRCLPVHCLYSERYMVGNSAVSTNLVRVNLDLVSPGLLYRYFGGVIHSTEFYFAWLRWRLLYFSIVCPSLVHFSTPSTIRSCQNKDIETGRDSDLRQKLFVAARLSFGYQFVAPEFICMLVSNFSQLVNSSKVAQGALFALFLK